MKQHRDDAIVTSAAKSLLARTRVAPLMFVATREGLLCRCGAALEMVGYLRLQSFYMAHMPGYPGAPNSFALNEPITEAWALAVIADAMERLS